MKVYLLVFCDPNSVLSPTITKGVFESIDAAVQNFCHAQKRHIQPKYLRGYATGWSIQTWDGDQQFGTVDLRDLIR